MLVDRCWDTVEKISRYGKHGRERRDAPDGSVLCPGRLTNRVPTSALKVALGDFVITVDLLRFRGQVPVTVADRVRAGP